MSEAHAPAAEAVHDEHDLAHLDRHVRAALIVFGALLALTGLTVMASYLHLPHGWAIAVALLIATVKGSLVLAWFMHLISERKLIYAVLSLTVFFFFAILFLPYWTAGDRPHLQGQAPADSPFSAAAPPPTEAAHHAE